MHKPINIYHSKYKNILENYNNIDIIDIDNIINYSISFIRFDYLQLFDNDTSPRILAILLNKLKLGGVLMLSLSNTKIISKLYADNVLSDTEFLSYVKDQSSIWSIEFLYDFIKKNNQDYEITKIQNDSNNHKIYVSIERKNI